MRFLRIHPVQSVVNNITQLSGRGFPCIFYNISAAGAVDRELVYIFRKTLFLTKVSKRNAVPDAVAGALRSLDIVVRLLFLCSFLFSLKF